jgi:transcriptional regulator with XRE-family HTH domain
MMFTERIKQLRKERQIPQKQLTTALGIETATYCKIERGDCSTRRERVVILAKLVDINLKDFLMLWLAKQIYGVVKDEKELADKALNIVTKHITS